MERNWFRERCVLTTDGVRLQAETLRDVGQVRAVWEQLLAWEVAR